MTYDVLIRNGSVVDGTGEPARHADVAVSGGKVVAVGGMFEGPDLQPVLVLYEITAHRDGIFGCHPCFIAPPQLRKAGRSPGFRIRIRSLYAGESFERGLVVSFRITGNHH